jgi:FlaG/FlaF family flagellin (archaellin)
VLRQQIEEYVRESMTIKDSIENKLKTRENQGALEDETFKANICSKMEEVTANAQKNIMENMELKGQLDFYKNKYEEMSNNIKGYVDKYQEFINQIEKVNMNNF